MAKRKKKAEKELLLRTLAALILIVAALILMALGLKHFSRPEPKPAEPVFGIDVSAHQGQIDWQAVAESGVEFAMIRLGYRGYETGSLHADEYARRNLEGAKAAGLQVGAYFFSQAVTPQEAREEAELALQVLDGMALDLPLAYDWEYVTAEARTGSVDGETLLACVDAFCTSLGDYQPMVYFNRELSRTLLDLEKIPQYPFWLAQYESELDFPYAVQMWQYTDSGTVAGIQGPVDLNRRFPVISDGAGT